MRQEKERFETGKLDAQSNANHWRMGVAMLRNSNKLRALLSFVLMVSAAWAQQSTGEITGTVRNLERSRRFHRSPHRQ